MRVTRTSWKWFTRSHSRQVPCDVSAYTGTEEDSGMWCYCRECKGGDMICCENKSSSAKLFHLECLQMTESPHGKQLCPTCHAISEKGNVRDDQFFVILPVMFRVHHTPLGMNKLFHCKSVHNITILYYNQLYNSAAHALQ